jgi:mediator of RNA polymerase II transcription subunit 10
MSVLPPYMSPAATPDTSASPAQAISAPTNPNAAGAGMEDAQIRVELERTLLKLSQDLYEMEICAGDVVSGQEDRVPKYL